MSDSFFISYSRRNQEYVLRLARDLREAGGRVWLDQLDIRPGDLWDRAIEAALRDCSGVLLVLSPSAVSSENVMDEAAAALEAGKRVIPVRIEVCDLPLRLRRVQFIDAVNRNYADVLARVSAAMNEVRADAKRAAPPLPREVPPMSPEVAAKLCALLTKFMGPISAHLVEEEGRRVASLEELWRRLADHIPDERESAQFIASARALGRSE